MTEQFGIKPVEIDKLLLPDFTEFLKKLGIGKTTTWAYMTCLRAMLNILSEQGFNFRDIENPVFQKEYFKVNRENRKMKLNTIKRFLWYKGLFDNNPGVSTGHNQLDETQEEYLKELKRRGQKQGTVIGSKCDTGKFIRFCLDQGVKELDGLSKRLVESFATHLFIAEENKYCLNKKIKILYELKSFFKYLFASGKTLINLSVYIEVPKREKKLSRNFFKRNEIAKLFKEIDTNTVLGFMDMTMFEILYGTGMRVGELCSLSVNDVDLGNGTIFIKQGKGNRDRVVPITGICKKYLNIYTCNVRERILRLAGRVYKHFYNHTKETDCLFITAQGKKLDEAVVSRTIIRYMADAGIKRHRTAHAFRYSCATHMLENGAEIRYISDLLGHRKLDTTGSYTKVSAKNLLEAIGHHPRAKEKSCKFKEARKRGY